MGELGWRKRDGAIGYRPRNGIASFCGGFKEVFFSEAWEKRIAGRSAAGGWL